MDDARARGGTVNRGRLLKLGLVAVTVVALVIGIAALVRGPQIPPSEDTALRQEARAATERFATAINSYDVTDLDPYVEKVKPLLTDDLAEQFEASTKDLLGRFAETEIVSKGKVEQVAIDSIDADSAETLAAITVSTEPQNIEYGQPRLRWKVSLVREGDTWLVANFANLTVEDEPAAESEGGDQ